MSRWRSRRVAARGGLVVRTPPPLHVQQRDPQRALHFLGPHDATPPAPPDRVDSIFWYHTIELPDGTVTPGRFDHRELVPHYGLPDSLHGQRALDVATFDGFWAFELERRGAQVTALDLDSTRGYDFPTRVRPLVDAIPRMTVIGDGFRFAHAALGSAVERIGGSVYDLDPQVHGTFDFVHCGDLLLHLRDPLTALERIRSVTAGTFLLSDAVDIDTGRGRYGAVTQYVGGWDDVIWWLPSVDALAQMLIDAGFREVRANSVYQLARVRDDSGLWRVSLTATA